MATTTVISDRTIRILKAAGRFRSNRQRRTWQLAHRLADGALPKFTSTLLTELRGVRNRVNVGRLSRAVAAGNVSEIENALELPSIGANLKRKYRRQIQEAVGRAGVANIGLQPKVLAGVFGTFDLTNPRAVEFARNRSSELVDGITDSAKKTIRNVIADGIQNGVPVRESARRLRDTVGLTDRQWRSVANFQNKQEARGVDPDLAQKRTDRFAKKVLRQRAETIARTETIAAGCEGKMELWRQSRDKGLLDPKLTTKRWIVTPDDRLDSAICLPMAGQDRDLDDPFTTGIGGAVDCPPAHPRCRCDVILNIPGPSLFADNTPAPRETGIPEPGRRRADVRPGPEPRRSLRAQMREQDRQRALRAGKPLPVVPAGARAPALRSLEPTQTPRAGVIPPPIRLPRRKPKQKKRRDGKTPKGMPEPTVTPDAVFQAHPELEGIRDDLVVENWEDPQVRSEVASLTRISPGLRKQMEGKVRIHVGNRPVTHMLGEPGTDNTIPKGYTTTKAKDGRGVYHSRKGIIAVNPSKGQAFRSTTLHEYGHAMGERMGMDSHEETIRAHRGSMRKLPRYYRQGGPGGLRGRQEMLAEATNFYHNPPPGMTGKQAVERFTTKRYADWLDPIFRSGKVPPGAVLERF